MLKQKTVLLTLTICAVVSLEISQPAYAQISEFTITADDRTENAEFGFTVSISGDHAVVGAHADDNFIGSAYVFKRTDTSWAQEDKLLPSDGDIADEFGWSVSISGDYVIVGAIQNDESEFDADRREGTNRRGPEGRRNLAEKRHTERRQESGEAELLSMFNELDRREIEERRISERRDLDERRIGERRIGLNRPQLGA